MATELPNYEVGEETFYFPLDGREITAKVDHSAPEKYQGTMKGLEPEDMKFTVGEVTDSNTGEAIPCTDEMRRLIAKMIHDHMTRSYEANE